MKRVNINSQSEKKEKYEALGKLGNEFSYTGCRENGKLITMDAIVSSITAFRGYCFIYADIQNKDGVLPCSVIEADDNVYVIFRHKDTLINKMKLNGAERKCIYFHEIAHKLSPNQKKGNGRLVENEIDADTFAIMEFGANPISMYSALKKTCKYALSEESSKKNTKEAIEAALTELKARLENVEAIIKKRKLNEKVKLTIAEYINKELNQDSDLYKLINERMESLQIEVMDSDSFSKYYRLRKGENACIPAGFYNAVDGIVRLRMSNMEMPGAFETAIHETVHALSDNRESKMGLVQYDEEVIGKMFNEMATCYITSKIVGDANGGGHSKDFREVFKMFLRTMKMNDGELIQNFFQSENWLSVDNKRRFDEKNVNALEELVRLYDKRGSKEFNKERVLELIEHSAITNHVENDEQYVESLVRFCNYFKMHIPSRVTENSFGKISLNDINKAINQQTRKKSDHERWTSIEL